jgi:hypothetical protein
VPDPEQHLWRTVTRHKLQMTRLHVRMQNQLESLLEEAIKLSCFVTDLLSPICWALARGACCKPSRREKPIQRL